MKILFNHIDPGVAQAASNVLIELGNYGVSCIWYNVHPTKVVGVRMYHFQEHSSGKEIAAHLRKLLSENEFYNKNIFTCLNVKESVLVPAAYFSHSALPAMISLMYGKDAGHVNSDMVQMDQNGQRSICYNGYRVHEEIIRELHTASGAGNVKHSTSLQIQNSSRGTLLDVIIYHHSIKLLLFKGGELQLVQQYSYKTPSDAAYITLNACHQHAIHPGEVEVLLSGIVDKDSNLFREISRYFIRVELKTIPENVEMGEELQEISAHYFSHLTQLISCV